MSKDLIELVGQAKFNCPRRKLVALKLAELSGLKEPTEYCWPKLISLLAGFAECRNNEASDILDDFILCGLLERHINDNITLNPIALEALAAGQAAWAEDVYGRAILLQLYTPAVTGGAA